ncbi:nickel pincer cofactor biosynthesis protein LarC [Halorarius litoreus]|uniref:nickel pincer cofactor biosynthesis protein LarC n=1 Tax=Halorarius litoreus TaxID=2962676 RepID=UPI0020CF4F1D|nr:nickel pincer cofactor biosynthesis protein LarC [Halorarius litoreus]
MRTLAFDGRTGAAGDMILGALLAAGADRSVLEPVEAALPVEFRVEEVDRNGIRATTVDVLLVESDGGEDDGNGHDHSHDHDEHDHTHDHDEHDHTHDHGDHSHEHTHAEGHGTARTYREVLDVVDEMALPEAVAADAEAVFRILGEAEAAVHGTDLEDTHFHEVGTDDAIADVVGSCLLLADLDPDRVVTTPVFAGGGEVEMSHGRYPVPAPAVVNVAASADWELRGGPVDTELLTPTGAAILAQFAEGVDSLPPMRVDGSGYGAGTKQFDDRPNVLRATVGEAQGELVHDDVRVLETNLDDASPEVLGGLQRSLKSAGARDVTVLPATMKKARPGHLVKVVVKPEDAQQVARRLAEETGTLGVRESNAGHRWVAERRFETVELEIDGETYEVTVKVASDSEGSVYDVSAEFDEADAVAAETGLATREVLRRAESKYRS